MTKVRTFGIWTLLVALLVALVTVRELDHPVWVTRAEFDALLAEGAVDSVRVSGDGLEFTDTDGMTFATEGGLDPHTWSALLADGVPVEWESGFDLAAFVPYLVAAVLLLAALAWWVRRKAQQAGASGILDLRKSRARSLDPGTQKTTFADVGGSAAAKERLGDVVAYLKDPRRWVEAGARPPRGVLLDGPPGCGKTLLARAVAGEAGVRFYALSASEFVEMFVGVGAARVRDLFDTAAKNAPSLIFIDELDAVGRRRGTGIGSSHDEREQTLNQLLVCLDGFERELRVVVIAATNRPDVLDAALLRPGRFDLHVKIPDLTEDERADTLRIHLRGKKLVHDVRIDAIARRTPGWNGARLEHLANEAALHAVRRADGDARVRMEDFERALAPIVASEREFDAVDAVLLESASQLAQPVGRAVVRVALVDGSVLDGDLVWANAAYLKLRDVEGEARVIAKAQIRTVQALPGTDRVDAGETVGDRWASAKPGVA